MCKQILFLLILMALPLNAQKAEAAKIVQDPNYLEDQFYVGISYNLLLNRPNGVTQGNLSYGLQGGFIKDIPINMRRNIAFGLGLGYAVNSYYSNLFASQASGNTTYTVLNGEMDYRRNKIEEHLLEIPLEFRWRTSTPSDYKFWRIYTGVKLGYVFGGRSKLVTKDEKVSFFNPDLQKLQYGLTMSFGYNTFNVNLYYALNDLFKDGTYVEDGAIRIKPLRIGLIFYIL